MAINGLATVLNAAWSAFLIIMGRRWRSPALAADGRHLFSDVATSIGVLIGLSLVQLTGYVVLDPLMAAAVALHILWSGWHVVHDSVDSLMDRSSDCQMEGKIRDIISSDAAGALEVHDLRTRGAGRIVFIEFHLVVPATMTVADAHIICDRLEAALHENIRDCQVTIHVEPQGEARHRGVIVL
jgi:cation diffusion facilitator family transporter